MYVNIPPELLERAQWCVWKYEQQPGKDKPTKPPFHPSGYKVDKTNPKDFSTFDTCLVAMQTGQWNGLGFILTKDDPYTFIDLDTYDPKLTPEDRERHKKIFAAFTGYAELSPSGQGLHLIVKGNVPQGRRRAGVEVYSDAAYMTMTGNVYRNGSIDDQQSLLQLLWDELAPESDGNFILPDDEAETMGDWPLCDKAAAAANGEKFVRLYRGQWQGEYSSQSEADFALIDIIAFYTGNRAQVARIFRNSELGKRDKAKRDNYVMPMVKRSFDNKPPKINFDAIKDGFSKMKATAADPPPSKDDVYTLPPGLLGEVAHYMFSAAPRPVPEIALCGAIGLLAGICGRAYNVSGTGLNHYLMLLAPTGSGKEAIAGGIAQLMSAVAKVVPAAADFVGPGEIRSDVALLKYLAKKAPSFVTIGGEFGQTLAMMADQHAPSHLRGIKRAMLDLYGKSGQGQILRPTIYSEESKNTLSVLSPSFSFIGESAPESFFDSVDERLISDGLLPRFTLIEYQGGRPALNPSANHPPSQALVENLAKLCIQASMLNNGNNAISVTLEYDAAKLMHEFDEECTRMINAEDSREVIRHIWNRAHLRALKLASLVAIGINPYAPMITTQMADWAIKISVSNTKKLLDRFVAGKIGSISTDDKHMAEIRRVVLEYLTRPFEQVDKYIDHPKLYFAKLIPKQYIQRRLLATAAFRLDRRGAANALSSALRMLTDAGELVEVDKRQLFAEHGLTMICYIVQNQEAFRALQRV